METVVEELRKFRTSMERTTQKLECLEELHEVRKSMERWNETMERSNRTLVSLLEKSNREMKLVKQVTDVTARKVELNVNHAIKDFLQYGKFLVEEGGYRWNVDPNDELDGLITGVLNGKEVIVFVEAKTSLTSMSAYRNAREQLMSSVWHWTRIRDVVHDFFSEEFSNEEFLDRENLEIATHSHRTVMLAFGAYHFPLLRDLDRTLKEQKEKRARENKPTYEVLLVTYCPKGQYSVITAGNCETAGDVETARG